MKKKKIYSLIAVTVMSVSLLLSGCGTKAESTSTEGKDKIIYALQTAPTGVI